MVVSQSNIAKIEGGKISPPYDLMKRIFEYLEKVKISNIGTVAQVTSRPVSVINMSDKVRHAVSLLKSTRFKQIPVKDEEKWVGCIYERTISRHLMENNDPRSILRRKVWQIMDESLPSVSEEMPIVLVVPLLQQSQAVLVTRKGTVTGIVTNTDLLKVIQ